MTSRPRSSPRALAAVLAVLALPAAPAAAQELVVWNSNSPRELAAFEKLAEAYNARHGAAGPRVRVVPVPFDGLADRVSGAVPRGKGPDVFLYPQDRLGGWVDAGGVVEPAERWVDAATRERFMPAALEALTCRGALQGLPLDFKLIALYFNRQLLASPPRNTADLAATARRLTDPAAGVIGLAYLANDYYYHAALQNGFGGRPFDERMRPALDSPENVRALQLLLRWREEVLPPEALTREQLQSLFAAGKLAMTFDGPWLRAQVEGLVSYGVAPLPLISEAGHQPMRPWLTVEGLYVSAQSRQKEAAFDFLRFVTDAGGARTMAVEGRQLPANQRAYLDPALLGDEELAAFFQQARVAVPMPNVPEMALMWGPVTSAMAMRRDGDPQAALAKAQRALLTALEQRRR